MTEHMKPQTVYQIPHRSLSDVHQLPLGVKGEQLLDMTQNCEN